MTDINNTNGIDLSSIDTSFDIENDFKPEPLIPPGTYRGNIIGTSFGAGHVRFKFSLADNGGYMSDGETEIDGNQLIFKLWLPKPGDETEYTASGRQTKRQWKINNMKKVFDELKITIKTFNDLQELVENQELIGTEIIAAVGLNEYNSNITNDVSTLTAQ